MVNKNILLEGLNRFQANIEHVFDVYISQLICFARICSNVSDFNNRSIALTPKLSNRTINIINFIKHSLKVVPDSPAYVQKCFIF